MSKTSNAEVLRLAYTRVSQSPEHAALIGENRVFNHIPQEFATPFVRVRWVGVREWDTKDDEGYEGTLQFDLWTDYRGDKRAMEWLDIMRELFHRNPLPLENGQNVVLHYDSHDAFVEPDGITHHSVVRFRLLCSEALPSSNYARLAFDYGPGTVRNAFDITMTPSEVNAGNKSPSDVTLEAYLPVDATISVWNTTTNFQYVYDTPLAMGVELTIPLMTADAFGSYLARITTQSPDQWDMVWRVPWPAGVSLVAGGTTQTADFGEGPIEFEGSPNSAYYLFVDNPDFAVTVAGDLVDTTAMPSKSAESFQLNVPGTWDTTYTITVTPTGQPELTVTVTITTPPAPPPPDPK